MKSILISIKPKWCALMMNGIKKIEVRKNKALASVIQKLINENGCAEIYVYCTKDKETIAINPYGGYATIPNKDKNEYFNGKVVFKFRCYEVEEWHNYSWQEITKNACLSDDELRDYSKGVASLYCIHISELEIFDRPKELSEFSGIRPNGLTYMLEKAPQNFAYLKENKSK